MHQILLGMAVPSLLAMTHYFARGRRATLAMLVLWPCAMLLGSLWAVAPDLPRLVGAHALYMKLANDPRTDIFMWHYTIDQIETDPIWSVFVVAAICAGFLFAAWRELAVTETQSNTEAD